TTPSPYTHTLSLHAALPIYQARAHGLGPVGGVEIAAERADDRALHENVPRLGELRGRSQPGELRAAFDHLAQVVQPFDAGLTERVVSAHLDEDRDERDAVEGVTAEPLVQHVEDREQAFLGGLATCLRAFLDQPADPFFLAAIEKGEDEIVLGGEVLVERRFRDAGTLDHFVHAYPAYAPAREQVVAGGQNPLSGARRRSWGVPCWHRRTLYSVDIMIEPG